MLLVIGGCLQEAIVRTVGLSGPTLADGNIIRGPATLSVAAQVTADQASLLYCHQLVLAFRGRGFVGDSGDPQFNCPF